MFPEISDVPDEIRQFLDADSQEKDIPDEADPDVVISESDEVDELKRSQSPSFLEDPEDCNFVENQRHSAQEKPPLIKQDDTAADVDKDVQWKEEVSKIKSTVDQVLNDVQVLRLSKRKAVSHIHRAEKRLESLDKRITNIDSLCSSHSNHISDLMEVETSRLGHSFAEKKDDDEKRNAALNALLDEMRVFREETSKQIAEEVEALKAARVEASAFIKDSTAHIQVRDHPSLKRKCSEDVNDGAEIEQDVACRKTKRPRKHIVSKVLQTAGVFTVGAVATWSALAFS